MPSRILSRRAVLAILDAGKATGEWHSSAAIVESLSTVVNEHDRHMREVQYGLVLAAFDDIATSPFEYQFELICHIPAWALEAWTWLRANSEESEHDVDA